jgi:two-component system, OmpR family, copper resistance phosphate regulon response regulator CusR
MRLLVAENDPALATFLQESVDHEHYSVDQTHDSEAAKKCVEEREYDLAILDLNLARDEGIQVLQFVRAKRRELPCLVLSGRNRADERVQILDMGADDLVLKPFAFSELSARVRALLRQGGRARAAETVLCIEDLELNRVERSVKRAGRAIELTPQGIWSAGVSDAQCGPARDARADHRACVEFVAGHDVCLFRGPVFRRPN